MTTRQEYLAVFRSLVEPFIQLNVAEWEYLENCFEEIYVPQNTVLQEQGKYVEHFYFLCDGGLRLYKIHEGKEITYNSYSHPRFLTDLFAATENYPSKYCIDTLVDSCILKMSLENVHKLLLMSPTFSMLNSIMYLGSLKDEMVRLDKVLTLSSKELFNDFRETHPNVFPQLSQKKLAACLNVSPESVSRFMKDLI